MIPPAASSRIPLGVLIRVLSIVLAADFFRDLNNPEVSSEIAPETLSKIPSAIPPELLQEFLAMFHREFLLGSLQKSFLNFI